MTATAVGRTDSAGAASDHRAVVISPAARRRALCELADLYAVEQSSNERPLTNALPALLPGLCAVDVGLLDALDLFDQVARARAVNGRASSTHEQMDDAERRAEQLLNRLVGVAA